MAAAICPECGYPVDSRLHQEGIGLHGHVRLSEAEATRQRNNAREEVVTHEPPVRVRRRKSE